MRRLNNDFKHLMKFNPAEIENSIFNIKNEDDFKEVALSVFQFQAMTNSIYKEYLQLMNIEINEITSIEQIPFLPIEFFKSHKVISGNRYVEVVFESSGTTGSIPSRHYVTNIEFYEKSFINGFEFFYGSPEDYCILALLPSYMERQNSSLVFMVNELIDRSGNPDSGFYLHNIDELIVKLDTLNKSGQKTLLIGVTFALLDLAEQHELNLSNIIIMETGGMKGRREEIVRSELHEILCKRLGVKKIHSEYGMTEMLSQAYSKGDGLFKSPPWLKILIRNVNDPMSIIGKNKTGGISIIDLANINSCSFIATQDLGRINKDDTFEVLGRFDNSDLRGCSLLVS